MNIVKCYENNSDIVRMYHIDRIQYTMDAINWISDVRTLDDMYIEFIEFCNLTNMPGEGSGDIQLSADISLEDMRTEFIHRPVDAVYLSCEFKGKPVVIGVNLANKRASITLRKSNPADLGLLESALGSIEV